MALVEFGAGYVPGPPIYFTASGNFVKANYPGLVAVIVECQGGGGGGGGSGTTGAGEASAGSGGGGGGYSRSLILVGDLDASEAVTVGAGGAPASVGNDSVFDTISGEVRAKAGLGGTQSGNTTVHGLIAGGGAGGAPGTGILALAGGVGGGGNWGAFGGAGFGGSSRLGASVSTGAINTNGVAGHLYGGGGSGSFNGASQGVARTGGAGAAGIVIVTPLYSNVSEGFDANAVPKGLIASAVQTASQGSIGTSRVDLTGLSVTFTAPGGRRYRLSAHVWGRMAAQISGVHAIICDPLGNDYARASLGVSANDWVTLDPWAIVTPAAGLVTYKVQSQTDVNTWGTQSTSYWPSTILVEDIGAA